MATNTWINTAGGAWSAGANWSTGTVPAVGDDVLINGAGSFTITSNVNQTAASVTLNDPSATLALNAGSLQTGGLVTLNQGTLTLNTGATLQDSTVVANGGVAVFNGGTLKSGAWKGTLDLSADNSSLNVLGTLAFAPISGVLPDVINLTGQSSTLNFENGETFTNVTLNLGAPGAGANLVAHLPGGVNNGTAEPLTFAANTSIDVLFNARIEGSTITNNGTIKIENGGGLQVGEFQDLIPGSVSNNGGTFVNNGSVSIPASGVFELLGYSTPAGLGNITSAGGVFQVGAFKVSPQIIGTLDLSSGTITTGSGIYKNFEVEGVVQNGTVINGGGAIAVNSATLANLTWLGALNIVMPLSSGPTFQNLSVLNIDGTSPGVINLTGTGVVSLPGTQTVANETINTNGSSISVVGTVLTLASNSILNGTTYTSFNAFTLNAQGLIQDTSGTLVFFALTRLTNSGTIQSSGPGSSLFVQLPSFINSGSVIGHSITIQAQQVTNSGQIVVDAGGAMEFKQANSNAGSLVFGGAGGLIKLDFVTGFGATIAGWANGDQVELASSGVYAFDAASTNNTLIIDQNGVQAATLAVGPGYTLSQFSIAQAGSGQPGFINVTCYARGTRVATPLGEVAIETLREGDAILLASGEAANIVWIGRRDIDCRRHPEPSRVWPVRVSAHAFGPGLPRRDLYLSPEHAVFVDGSLVPIRLLINDTTIRQEQRATAAYYHIELDHHDIMLAEGLPAETYLDTGDRAKFDNGGDAVSSYPDCSARTWEMEGCAPLLLTGAKLASIRDRFSPRRGARSTPSTPALAERRRPASSPAVLAGPA